MRNRFRQPMEPGGPSPRQQITSNRIAVPARQAGNRFLGSLKGLQIRAQESIPSHRSKAPPMPDPANKENACGLGNGEKISKIFNDEQEGFILSTQLCIALY
jgi:hypothetical protein